MNQITPLKTAALFLTTGLVLLFLAAACRPAEIEPGAAVVTIGSTVDPVFPNPTPYDPELGPGSEDVTPEATSTIPTRTPVPKDDIGQTGREGAPREDILQRVLDQSPDGRWTVETIESLVPVDFEDGVFYYVALNLLSTDGSQNWPVVAEWRPSGLGQDYPRPFSWSADGNYYFYSNVPQVDGCSFFTNGSDLWRVDLETGVQSELLPRSGLVLALAPDEARLAYAAFGGRGLVLRDLATGVEREVDLPLAGEIGRMAWSLDSERLLVTVGQNSCGLAEELRTALVLVEWATGSADILLGPDDRDFVARDGLLDGRFALDRPDGTVWTIDPAEGESSLNTLLLAGEMGELPEGTVFEARPLLYEVVNGQPPRQLGENPIAVSPGDHRYLLRFNQGGQTVLVDTADGSERKIGEELLGINFMGWPEENLILFGVFLSVEDEGPNLGHLALYDIAANELRVLDRDGLMYGELNLAGDGVQIAYDRNGRGAIYNLVEDRWSYFDPTAFSGWTYANEVRLTSGSWSPDGSKISWTIGGGGVLNGGWGLATAVFDLKSRAVQIVHPYDPVGRGGWPPAPLWSPDGDWIVVNEWGTIPDAAGLIVMRPDGGERVQLVETNFGIAPVWSSQGELFYSRIDENGQVTAWIYQPLNGKTIQLVVPEGFSRFFAVP